ncbi:MAG: autotransporter domain-containing protein [Methylococcales symbiont of Hymedesmia sp. n. MRB-2018]|nr:MAG: autotransporter domain-containing protein [Methylococcales symbiont of Hymedesmia sp. n. MRB-2018]
MPTTTIPTISRLIAATLLLLSVFLFSASAQASSHLELPTPVDRLFTSGIAANDAAGRALPEATGGTPPYRYSMFYGTQDLDEIEVSNRMGLMEFNTSSGSRSFFGTLRLTLFNSIITAPGRYDFSYRVTDGAGASASATIVIDVVLPSSVIEEQRPESPQRFTVGEPITNIVGEDIFANGRGPYIYTISWGSGESSLPIPGLMFPSSTDTLSGTPTDTLSGTPEEVGSHPSVTIRRTDSTNSFSTVTFAIEIAPETARPTVTSIVRTTPTDATTNADSLTWTVTFSENVENVDSDDFMVIGSTATVVDPVTGSEAEYTVTVTGGDLADLNGVVTLGFADDQGIVDTAGNILDVTTPPDTNEVYTLEQSALAPITQAEAPITQAEEQVLNAVLPQMLRATTKITRDNISNRIDQAFASSPADTDANLNLGGSSSLQELINNNARTTLQDGLNIKQMFNNSSFLIPLNVAGDNNYGINNITLWGSGDYLSLEEDSSGVDWEGEVIGGSVGIDARLNQNLIAGAALSYSEGDADYKRDGSENNSEDTLTNTLYSIHPYIAYDLSQGRVWGALGYGQGEVEINDKKTDGTKTKSNRDTELYSLAFGGSGDLLSSDNWLNIPGTTTLRLKGEVSLSNIKLDKSNLTNAKALSIDAHRYRMALESSHRHILASGASISPSIELGIRYDDGSGETGGGIELAGSYRYSSPIGLEMELRAHGLLVHESSYQEWGLSGLVKYQANSSGQGLWLSLQPAFGDTPGNVADGVWQQPTVANNVNDEDNSNSRRLQLNTELGYGLPGFFGRGLLTPYAGLGIANGTQSYNIGGRWKIDSTMNLNLIGEHKKTDDSIQLRGNFRF